jgi:hypothetical protein
MSAEVCDNCGDRVSAEQFRLWGCCAECEGKLRTVWARMDDLDPAW